MVLSLSSFLIAEAWLLHQDSKDEINTERKTNKADRTPIQVIVFGWWLVTPTTTFAVRIELQIITAEETNAAKNDATKSLRLLLRESSSRRFFGFIDEGYVFQNQERLVLDGEFGLN